ncbi:MAG: hypothetical protein GSR78_01600 [Desulfurococcales archaeon]|nr:hypothetical protein [Desulfurococcales archaeon]
MGRLARSDACLAALEVESRRLDRVLELERELEELHRRLLRLERELDKLVLDAGRLTLRLEEVR